MFIYIGENILFMHDAMDAFNEYNAKLTSLYHGIVHGKLNPQADFNVTADDATSKLRSLVPIEYLRKAGSFFTGDILANRAVELIEKPTEVLDPACGAGNLLTAFTKKLAVKETIDDTLKHWGRVLHGRDLYPQFVEATKIRIILEALNRGANCNGKSLDELKNMLCGIKQGDAFELNCTKHCKLVLMNPPYRFASAPLECNWTTGRLNEAALFAEFFLKQLPIESTLIAILPDVLRSGTRYGKWRDWIETHFHAKIVLNGRFDSRTDVDVFLLVASRIAPEETTGSAINWETQMEENVNVCVGSYFDVRVGPVVPYRDDIAGDEYPFVSPSDLPRWGIVSHFEHRCGYKGTKLKPPFVAIRRTSSPSDRDRAAATIVVGNEPVAVENHLIVAIPHKDGMRMCKRLLKLLRSENTNKFLNRRIRCRHLTVEAVKDIKW